MESKQYLTILLIALLVSFGNGRDVQRPLSKRDEQIAQIDADIDKAKAELDVAYKNEKVKDRVHKTLETARAKVKENLSDKDNVAAVGAAVKGLVDNINRMKSSDPLEVSRGVMDTVSGFVGLLGPKGAAIAGVISVVSAIVGMFEQKPSMTEIIDGMLRKHIDVARRSELYDMLKGAQSELQSCRDYMEAFRNNASLTSDDLTGLQTQGPRTKAVAELGNVESYLTREVDKFQDKGHTEKQQFIGLIRAWVDVAVLRENLLITEIYILSLSNLTSTEVNKQEQLQGEQSRRATVLKFLRSPKFVQAPLVSHYFYQDSANHNIETYLNKNKIAKNLNNKNLGADTCGYSLHATKWSSWYMMATANWNNGDNTYNPYNGAESTAEKCFGYGQPSIERMDAESFIFEPQEDGRYYKIRSAASGWTNSYWYIGWSDRLYMGSSDKGDQGKFRVLQLDNGNIVIICKHWSMDWAVVMDDAESKSGIYRYVNAWLNKLKDQNENNVEFKISNNKNEKSCTAVSVVSC